MSTIHRCAGSSPAETIITNFPCIIAGSRTIDDYAVVRHVIELAPFWTKITEVVSGRCPQGVDVLGERWAAELSLSIKPFPADWNTYGKKAGPMRNEQMAIYCQQRQGGCIVIWDGKSRGSANMISLAKMYSLELHVVNVSASASLSAG